MIFKPELVRLIKRGAKTQTRRLVREYVAPDTPYRVDRHGRRRRRPTPRGVQLIDGGWYRTPPSIGASVAVQPGRGKAQECRIVILDVRHELVGDIQYTDAIAEGFRTTADFKAYWTRLYESTLMRGVDDTDAAGIVCEPPDHDLLVERFDARHATTPVWVITFALDTSHHPRLLAPASRMPSCQDKDSDDAHGYIDAPARALPDEPEAIDAGLLAHYTADAHDRLANLPGRREEQLRRRAQSLANRLRQAAIADARAELDTAAQLDLIEQHITLLERRRRAA